MTTAIQLSGAQVPSTELLKKLVGSADYLGYLQQVQANAELAGPPHSLPAGNFVYVMNGDPIDLGKNIAMGLLTWRPAARIVDKSSGDTKVTTYYDSESEEFRAIQAEASKPGQQTGPITYYFGPEFLTLINVNGESVFATFFANSKTTRRIAREQLNPLLGKWVTFQQDFITTAKHRWWAFKAQEDSVGIDVTVTQEQVNEEIRKFVAADEPATEADEGGEAVAADDNDR